MNLNHIIKNFYHIEKHSPQQAIILKSNSTDMKKHICALYDGEGKKAFYHLKTWLPYFVKSNIDFCIIVRDKSVFTLYQESFANIPIYYANTSLDFEYLINQLSALKSIIYTSYRNAFLPLRYKQFNHIYIGHGDSDKKNNSSNILKAFSEIWVTGKAQIDRLKNEKINMSGTVFRNIGLPQVKEHICFTEKQTCHQQLEKHSILYMPTLKSIDNDSQYTSLDLAIKFLPAICGLGIRRFGIKLHPSNYISAQRKAKELVGSLRANNIEITTWYSSTLNAESLFRNHNIYVCDCSSIVTSCLAINSPLFVYIPNNSKIQRAVSDIDINTYAYTFSCPDEFIIKFQKFHFEGDYLTEGRLKAREYFIDMVATKNDYFIKELKKLSHFDNA